MNSCILRSNDGCSYLRLDICSFADWASGKVSECNIELFGTHVGGDHDQDVSFRAEGVFLAVTQLQRLESESNRWLRLPFRKLAKSTFAGAYELAADKGTRIGLAFGRHNDDPSTLNLAVSIEFSIGSFEGNFDFVTDQSCLEQFRVVLNDVLDLKAT